MPDASARLTAALADRYRLERELGQGGMATVYLAEDLKHHPKVALKADQVRVLVANKGIVPNRQLTSTELKELFTPLGAEVRERLSELSGGASDFLWALRRKLAKELSTMSVD